MISRLLSVLLLSGSLGMAFSLPFPLPSFHLPQAVEKWLWNPRERTNAAISDYRKGDKESRQRAAAEADTALRLAPGDPRVQYDDGTIHLGEGNSKEAAKALSQAVKSAGPDLAEAASYNLGNAHLAAGDFDPAIAAYQQALRIDPADKNAKWNLELALRQRSDHPAKGSNGAQGSQGGGGSSSPKPGNDQQSQQQNPSAAADPGKSPQQAGGNLNPGGQGQPQPRPGDQPLPQFRNQPDMSAAEAAALLESVENLERQQRRAQAAQHAQRRAAKGRDW